MNIPGVILAGGLARRMGGGDKPLRVLAGRSLMTRAIERLSPQVSRLAINANGDLERLASFALPVIADSLPDHPGPLAGILAAMEWAGGHGASHVLTIAGDTPFLPGDFCARLKAAVEAGAPLALAATIHPEDGLWTHPTSGLWPVSLRGELRETLEAGFGKVISFAKDHRAAIVEFPADPFDPFFNVNTPDDMARAEEIVAEHGL